MKFERAKTTVAATANRLCDFAVDRFEVIAFCEDCGHFAALDRRRLKADISIPELCPHLCCTRCHGRTASIRIVYTGAGGYHHRR